MNRPETTYKVIVEGRVVCSGFRSATHAALWGIRSEHLIGNSFRVEAEDNTRPVYRVQGTTPAQRAGQQ